MSHKNAIKLVWWVICNIMPNRKSLKLWRFRLKLWRFVEKNFGALFGAFQHKKGRFLIQNYWKHWSRWAPLIIKKSNSFQIRSHIKFDLRSGQDPQKGDLLIWTVPNRSVTKYIVSNILKSIFGFWKWRGEMG